MNREGAEGLSPEQKVEEPPYPSEGYAWYVVVILLIVYVFSFIDRQIFAFLVGPLKTDLQLTDFQISLLMGFSFAVFYTFFGIPMGRLADSRTRRGIIAAGLFLWSLTSAGCGLAKTYTHLLLLRIGVGVGEATLSPSAYSLLTDYFKPKRVALAISIYGAGIYIGSGLAFLLGGVIVEFVQGREDFIWLGQEIRPWQMVFFIIGLPGMLFTAVVFTIKEPYRRGVLKREGTSVPLSEVVEYVRANWKTFLCHNVGFGLLSLIGYGGASWIPTFYARTHGWSSSETGLKYGIAVIILGSAGIIFGGQLSAWLADRGYKDAKIRAGFIAAVAHVPFAILFPILEDDLASFVLLLPAIFTLAMPFGVAPAAIQEMMPNRMRGQASAIYLFVVNLIGLGLGPSAVAFFTDKVFADESMVRYSLLVVSTAAGGLSIMLLWFAMHYFKQSLGHLTAWQNNSK